MIDHRQIVQWGAALMIALYASNLVADAARVVLVALRREAMF